MKTTQAENLEQSLGPTGAGLPTRRSFFDYLLGSTVVATLGALLYPILKFMSPPQVIESTESSVVAAKVSEVKVNSGKVFKFGSKPGIIVRTAAGELKACSAICTHLDCIVPYRAGHPAHLVRLSQRTLQRGRQEHQWTTATAARSIQSEHARR